MKRLLVAASLLAVTIVQAQTLTLPAQGGNKRAMISEKIGLTDVTIRYHRPGVKGREGKIWGQLIPVGYSDLGFGTAKESPWRAGANESTTIEFSTEVKIEGQSLPAGKYGFFIAYGPQESTVIFSKDNTSWGAYYYDPKKDALRVKVKPVTTDRSTEWLKYEFTDQTESKATVSLSWEKLTIPFTVEVDLVKTQLESFRAELRTERGFVWQGWQTAAQWSADHNTNLEEALQWADSAVNQSVGERNFVTLSTKAAVLEKLGRTDESLTVMKEALPMGNMNELHQYGRKLLTMKKTKEALEVFKINLAKNPGQFTPLMGATRGYSAAGDYKAALENAQKALPLAPNAVNKTAVEKFIGMLKEGKDIN